MYAHGCTMEPAEKRQKTSRPMQSTMHMEDQRICQNCGRSYHKCAISRHRRVCMTRITATSNAGLPSLQPRHAEETSNGISTSNAYNSANDQSILCAQGDNLQLQNTIDSYINLDNVSEILPESDDENLRFWSDDDNDMSGFDTSSAPSSSSRTTDHHTGTSTSSNDTTENHDHAMSSAVCTNAHKQLGLWQQYYQSYSQMCFALPDTILEANLNFNKVFLQTLSELHPGSEGMLLIY